MLKNYFEDGVARLIVKDFNLSRKKRLAAI